MNTFNRLILLFAVLLVLLACNSFAPALTATPAPTETSLPTSTDTPEPTEAPTETSVPPTETSSAPVLPIPSGEPLSEWEGIPIMSGAIAGGGDSQGYSFTIESSLEEIHNFYETELAKLGWNKFATGEGTTGTVLSIFMKDAATLSVTVIPQTDGIMLVLLVK